MRICVCNAHVQTDPPMQLMQALQSVSSHEPLHTKNLRNMNASSAINAINAHDPHSSRAPAQLAQDLGTANTGSTACEDTTFANNSPLCASTHSAQSLLHQVHNTLDNHAVRPFQVTVQAFEAYTDEPVETSFHAIPTSDLDLESQMMRSPESCTIHLNNVRNQNTASFSRLSSMLRFRMFGLGSGVVRTDPC